MEDRKIFLRMKMLVWCVEMERESERGRESGIVRIPQE